MCYPPDDEPEGYGCLFALLALIALYLLILYLALR